MTIMPQSIPNLPEASGRLSLPYIYPLGTCHHEAPDMLLAELTCVIKYNPEFEDLV
jgi:hypothetical protein